MFMRAALVRQGEVLAIFNSVETAEKANDSLPHGERGYVSVTVDWDDDVTAFCAAYTRMSQEIE